MVKQVSVRLSNEGHNIFKRKCISENLKDNYTTQNKVLAQLVDQYNIGKVKMPWEKQCDHK